jgi:hypothetical protein
MAAEQGADLHLDGGFAGNLVGHHGKMVASKRWVGQRETAVSPAPPCPTFTFVGVGQTAVSWPQPTVSLPTRLCLVRVAVGTAFGAGGRQVLVLVLSPGEARVVVPEGMSAWDGKRPRVVGHWPCRLETRRHSWWWMGRVGLG